MFGWKGGSGRGLAPTRGHIVLHMTHIYYGPTVGACIALHCITLHCNVLQYIAYIYIYIYIYNHMLSVGAGFETKTHVLSVGASPKRRLHSFQTV
jgi:hypothetical protein